MKPFRYERANSVTSACASAAEPAAKFIAGGTNLIDLMKLHIEAPARLVDLGDVAARDRPRIVDEKVDVGAVGGELVDIAAVAEVEREDPDADIVFAGDLGPRRFEIGRGARYQDDVASFLGQDFGAGPPDAFRGAGDQRLPPPQTQIHVDPPTLERGLPAPTPTAFSSNSTPCTRRR